VASRREHCSTLYQKALRVLVGKAAACAHEWEDADENDARDLVKIRSGAGLGILGIASRVYGVWVQTEPWRQSHRNKPGLSICVSGVSCAF